MTAPLASSSSDQELTVQEADDLRTRVQKLVREHNEDDWAIAAILYKLWRDLRHIERWGHRSWASWVERELSILPRKAAYLRQLHEHFVVEQQLPDVMFARLRRLGWTKARLLVGVMTPDNAPEMLARAESMTNEDLQAYRTGRSDRNEGSVGPASEPHNGVGTPPHALADDAPETRKRVIGDLFGDQIETYELAMKRSKELSKSEKVGHNLSLICLDFLATNDFKFANEEQRLRFLAKFENLMGYKLVIIDPEAGDVVYGLKALETLARTYSGNDGSEAP